MREHRHLQIPDALADLCDPERLALLVYAHGHLTAAPGDGLAAQGGC
jgi:hypothetical protein